MYYLYCQRNLKNFLYFLCFLVSVTSATLVQMRIVKETANYGYFGNNAGDIESSNRLVPSVLPCTFNGPELMQKLVGKCYNLSLSGYRYTFCPFQNITQYEMSLKWDAYKGILGIWSHWDIENNTFSAMVHTNGDYCGDIHRSVKIFIQCGSDERLLSVQEPSKCQYIGTFQTRFACHPDALLVYPRLNEQFQKEWDELYTDFHYGDITEKGYREGLQKIFAKAGLSETPITKSIESTAPTTTLSDSGTFVDLLSCNKEYKNLQNEISKLNRELEALKLLVDLKDIK